MSPLSYERRTANNNVGEMTTREIADVMESNMHKNSGNLIGLRINYLRSYSSIINHL